MHDFLLKRYLQLKDLCEREVGQDLVEYALIVSLIALGATASVSNFATQINTIFSNFGVKIGTTTT
jgi:Flp pilus assembly pilin Flp